MELHWELVWDNLPLLLRGAQMTLQVTMLAAIIGVVGGTFVGLARLSRSAWLRLPSTVLVEVVRGTPLLVQLFIIFFGLPALLQIRLPEFTAGAIAFGVNSSGYVAEIVRAGIQSIDRGQTEAGLSLGLSPATVMRHVILPQAFKRVLPPLMNEFSALLKNSSLVATISLIELTRSAQMVIVRTYRPFEMYIAIAVMYLMMTLAVTQLANALERRWRVSD